MLYTNWAILKSAHLYLFLSCQRYTTLLTGKTWKMRQICGSCQSDWNNIYYPEAEWTEEELDKLIRADIKHLSTRLTAYKRPVNIVITKQPLPRTATRKVKRKEVKQLVTA